MKNTEISDRFSRTEMMLGEKALEKLSASRVAVFGLGGVGGYVVEALARTGIGALDLIDNDVVNESNINRQIIATSKTVGKDKVEAALKRVHRISPECSVRTFKTFFMPETADEYDFEGVDYVVDAIDTVKGKLAIIEKAKEKNIPVISCMGTGNKLDPTMFEVADISKTSVCPLAKVMRKECKSRNIKKLKVVYSKEKPMKSVVSEDGRNAPGSVAFVPAVAGLIIAGEVIKDLVKDYINS